MLFRSLKFGLVEVVYEWAKGMVRPSFPARAQELTSSAGLQPDHGVDGRAGGNDRARYYEARRDVSRSAGRGEDRGERGSVQEDGGVPAQDQEGYCLLC